MVIAMRVLSLMIALLSLSLTTSWATILPANSRPYIPILRGAIQDHWPTMPLRHIPAGQVEQESGWKEKATLKTKRELGRGFGQLTITYRADGSERFNTYREAVKYKALSLWDWQRDPYNVRYQLAYVVLQDRANYRQMEALRFVDAAETWKAALVCYNAGPGRVLNRHALALAKGIPHDRWAGGLDRAYSPKEATILYGRPLYAAVNEYPRVVFQRAAKYRGEI